LNIIVCIKQVPGTTAVEIDPETGVLKRTAADAKLNPYDLFAIEEALTLAEKTGGGVTALSMGPAHARAALLEAVYMGADRGVLLNDRRFAGADCLATAYALSQAAARIGFDLIVCGKQTTDGDTAQVGAETAEFLGVPHAANVLTIEVRQNGVTVAAGQENRIVTQRMPLPCLLCVDGGINTPRLPSYKRKRSLTADPIQIMTIDDLFDKDESKYGLAGSPTQVEHIFTPEANAARELIAGGSEYVSGRLAAILAEMKYIN